MVTDSLLALQERMHRIPATKSRLTILPGSGVNAQTALGIIQALFPLGLTELHASAGEWVESRAAFRKLDMGMGVPGPQEWSIRQTSEAIVAEIRTAMAEAVAGSR